MLGLAAIFLAAASATPAPALTTVAPWWEKITYTVSGDGEQRACRYESSIGGGRNCTGDERSSPIRAASSATSAYTRVTIERRFTPGPRPDPVTLSSGDTMLGRQVLALAIDEAGKVSSCQIVLATGDVRPAYGCDQARTERFDASAPREEPEARQGFMTIIVYGHEAYLA